MRHLLKTVNLKSKLKDKYIMLFLDFDGTLVPIVDKPDKAVISAQTKKILAELSKLSNCRISVISGRDINYIKNQIGMKNIVYAGNHGFEMEDADGKFKKFVPIKYKATLKKIKKDLKNKLSFVKGVFIEDKGLSLSVHYRMVDKKEVWLVKDVFCKIANPYLKKNDIKIKKGKKLLEIRPIADWDKGKAVLRLLSKQKSVCKNDKILPVYIGDDLTDEDAFKVLKDKGITVFVGRPKKSYADFYLKNTKEVKEFLIRIRELLNAG